jgi:hypothetical protein
VAAYAARLQARPNPSREESKKQGASNACGKSQAVEAEEEPAHRGCIARTRASELRCALNAWENNSPDHVCCGMVCSCLQKLCMESWPVYQVGLSPTQSCVRERDHRTHTSKPRVCRKRSQQTGTLYPPNHTTRRPGTLTSPALKPRLAPASVLQHSPLQENRRQNHKPPRTVSQPTNRPHTR